MSQINVNKVISPSQAHNGQPAIDVFANNNVTFDTDTTFVDAANDRIGINTATPGRTLDIQGSGGIGFNAGLTFENCTLTGSGLSGTSHHSVEDVNAKYWNATASGNWTYNIRWNSGTTLNSKMAIGETINVSYIAPVASSSYYQSGFTIDGSSVTVYWLASAAPTQAGTPDSEANNGYDVYVFAINKTANATYHVLGSQTHFGSF